MERLKSGSLVHVRIPFVNFGENPNPLEEEEEEEEEDVATLVCSCLHLPLIIIICTVALNCSDFQSLIILIITPVQ